MNHVETADATLDRLLEEAGASMGAAEVRRLVSGVAAAPDGPDPTAWMDLVATGAGDGLRHRLAEMVESERARHGRPAPGPAERLEALRREIRRRRLAGFVVPHADEHQGEYLPACAERLAWLTGFTGSAGLAIVLREHAAVFVDGRYTVQLRAQVDDALYEARHVTDEPPAEWIAEHLPARGRLGYDPWLHTPNQVTGLRAACRRAGGRLVPVADNPVDAAWEDRPPPPLALVVPHDEALAGQSSADKRTRIADALRRERQDATVLSAPDSIAWVLNVRGGDVPYAPLPLAFAVLHADAAIEVFVDGRKLAGGVAEGLGDGVSIAAPEAFGPALDDLGANKRTVLVDPDGTPDWVARRLAAAGADVAHGLDPCALPKAVKNAVELDGIRGAHRRDGAAVCRFLAWLEGAAERGTDEIGAADRLEALRSENEGFRGLSFPTISAAGPNGAVVHYRVRPETNRRLELGTLYLVDSGAQYLDGTTDVTRTVAIGPAGDEERRRFTRVLKGHIAIATARFPKGTTGSQIDALARQALWAVGLDYDHGTGHGVGAYLGVHEGPHRISKLPNRVPLEPGMIVSNEPGYYRTDHYGIRIENLVAVRRLPPPDGAEKEVYGFETLTLAPIDRALVDVALLTPAEIGWLDAYHRRVRETLTPLLDPKTATWLADATRPLGDAG